jgi:hypothetical protein
LLRVGKDFLECFCECANESNIVCFFFLFFFFSFKKKKREKRKRKNEPLIETNTGLGEGGFGSVMGRGSFFL